MKENLDDIVSSAFSNAKSNSPPSFIWDSIDNELQDSKIDDLARDGFNNLESERAPDTVWENVQDQLDIDRVWDRISLKLSKTRDWNFLRYASIFAIILIPFYLDFNTSYKTLLTGLDSISVEGSSEINESKTEDISRHSEELITSIDEPDNIELNDVFKRSKNHDQVEINVPSDKELKLLTPVQENKALNSQLEINRENIELLAPSGLFKKGIVEIDIKKRKQFSKWSVGLTGAIENTWLLNNNTRRGFDVNSTIENKLSFGYSAGVFFDYKWHRNFGITVEYSFVSKANKNYRLYNNGEYQIKNNQFHSQRFGIIVGWNSTPKPDKLLYSTVLRSGLYYSRITDSYEYTNGVITELNNYKQNDLGVRLELGQRIQVKQIGIELGLRSDIGVLNITKSNSLIPSKLNQSHLMSGGVYLKLSYNF